MKITASGGTDGANIVLFWPDNLPDEADTLVVSDPLTFVENLRDEGKLIRFPCDGDGGYTVAIYVSSPVPDDLLKHCTEEAFIPTLVARGAGYFGGLEYMFKHDSSFRKKYPAMCGQVSVADGTYSAQVYRTDIPASLYESWLLSQAGAKAKRIWDTHGIIAASAVVGAFASLVAFFFVTWTVWFFILAIASPCALGAVAMSRTEAYKNAARARDAFEKAYPSYVVHME